MGDRLTGSLVGLVSVDSTITRNGLVTDGELAAGKGVPSTHEPEGIGAFDPEDFAASVAPAPQDGTR